MITLDDLKAICPRTKSGRLAVFIEPLNDAMREFDVDENPAREAAFLAQVAHESGGFNYVRELASGEAYDGRKDLGNVRPGDGELFRGRGLLQITGRANYKACGDALGIDLVGNPSLLEQPDLAARASAWWWKAHGCNEIADAGDFKRLTRIINGGLNGYSDRLAYYERAKDILA